jgi:hypothetical protein
MSGVLSSKAGIIGKKIIGKLKGEDAGAPGEHIDTAFYREMFPDLTGLSDEQARAHYLKIGRAEGRVANRRMLDELLEKSSTLDVEFYRNFHPDLKDLSPFEARQHYVLNGAGEGRFANIQEVVRSVENEGRGLPEDFDAAGYLELNKDLRRKLTQPWEPAVHYLRHGRWEGRLYKPNERPTIYDLENLNQLTSNVYNMPEVVVDEGRRPTVNVLVPAFDFASMSAGFFGVFQVARFIALQCGFAVRLVLFERFEYDEAECRRKLKNYPGLESLFDELEVVYLGEREEPLHVSPRDNCVATVWYSAYFARAIMAKTTRGKFLYLIQDYESPFYPASAMYAFADASYSFDYCALFSSQALQDFFLKRRIGIFAEPGAEYIYFNNACSSVLLPKDEFIAARQAGRPKRLTFYSRPPVYRNMFELGALALITACNQGVFAEGEWEFIGIGLGDARIELGEDRTMTQMQRMNLAEYQTVISTFDIGLCLMASPHPSLLPFDLSGSGAVVVTNGFANKDQAYFDGLTRGVIVADPDVPAIVEALRRAVAQAKDLETRYENARAMSFPRSWEQTFGEAHVQALRTLFQETGMATAEGRAA